MGAFSEHFQSSELECSHCGKNECKPELLEALEWMRAAGREKYGGGVIMVLSAYRCSEHPVEKKVVLKRPPHQLGIAADIQFVLFTQSGRKYLTGAQLEALAASCPLITGYGRNDEASVIHVDVRDWRTHDSPSKWVETATNKNAPYFPPPEAAA